MHAYGWASVFYIFGSLGVVWFVLWLRKAASGPVSDTRVSEKEREYIVANTCEQVRAWITEEMCRCTGSSALPKPLSAYNSKKNTCPCLPA